jgi:hypothetical protein
MTQYLRAASKAWDAKADIREAIDSVSGGGNGRQSDNQPFAS